MSSEKVRILAISGSRENGSGKNLVYQILDDIRKNSNELRIHVGDCKTGVDEWVRAYVKKYNIPHKYFVADWDNYGLKAGPLRNIEMMKNSDRLLAFPRETSKGTKQAIEWWLKNKSKKSLTVLNL